MNASARALEKQVRKRLRRSEIWRKLERRFCAGDWRMRFSWILAAASIALLASAPAQAASPFVGAWDCGVATFTFTETTYNNGSETMRMTRVEKKGADYVLSFPDKYKIMLSGISAKTMSWYSGASGDSFECKRVK
jgi:hypothetical protein